MIDTKHSISSPGDNSVFAYEFDQTGATYSSTNPASVSQNLAVTVGQAYLLTFRTYFDRCTQSEGFVGVILNNVAVYTVDACDFGSGVYENNTVTFTATVSLLTLQFQFLVGEPTAVVKIDNGPYNFHGIILSTRQVVRQILENQGLPEPLQPVSLLDF